MKKHFVSVLLIAAFPLVGMAKAVTPAADIPVYYSAVDGKSGESLFSALTSVTRNGFSTLGYDGLYTAYQSADVYPADSTGKAGELWDMYGGCEFAFSNKCGQYKKECDCYNREHSIPQSWWGGGTGGIGCDIFHVVPTDGKVNGMRSNNTFGEVSSATYSYNGCKLGTAKAVTTVKKTIATSANESVAMSGKVFEPQDQYKGDFARGYLGVIMKWNGDGKQPTKSEGSKVFSGTYTAKGYYGLTKAFVALLMKWHREDPVSQKEIDRNNGIQKTQGNRNPFIDYPYLAEYIWGEHAGETVDMDMLISSSDPDFIPGESDGYRQSTEPTFICATSSLTFPTLLEGQTSSLTFELKALRLTDGITLAISGANANQFSVTPASIAAASAVGTHTIKVTYTPTTKDVHNATLTISSTGAQSVSILLGGACAKECILDWIVNCDPYTVGNPTTKAAIGSKIAVIPTAPTSCSQTSSQFVGWSQTPIDGVTDELPDDLFTDESEAPSVVGDMTFYAVFAHVSEQGGGEAEEIEWDITSTWAHTGMSEQSKYWVLQEGASLTSPDIDLARLQSIMINMRTYGGTQYNTIEVTANGTKIASIVAANGKNFAEVTWTNTGSLTGTHPLVFTSPTCKVGGGPGIDHIVISVAGKKYAYDQFITSCKTCGEPTDLEPVLEQLPSATKFMQNGRIYIIKNNNKYTILGQTIKNF